MTHNQQRYTRGNGMFGGLTVGGGGITFVGDAGGGAVIRSQAIAIDSTPTGAEQDTGWDLPAKAMVLDVLVDVETAEATGGTKTMTVGLKSSESGGDADGFAVGLSAAT